MLSSSERGWTDMVFFQTKLVIYSCRLKATSITSCLFQLRPLSGTRAPSDSVFVEENLPPTQIFFFFELIPRHYPKELKLIQSSIFVLNVDYNKEFFWREMVNASTSRLITLPQQYIASPLVSVQRQLFIYSLQIWLPVFWFCNVMSPAAIPYTIFHLESLVEKM